MATKQFVTRVQHKHDTEANWLKATNFKPLAGEIIIYDADATHSEPRMKIGDGETLVSALPFAGAQVTVDTALSNTSTNPVQNKAITARVNKLQGDLNDFIAEVPDLIRQHTLCVGADERGQQVTHSVAQIYQHVQDGGQVILLHPDYPGNYFTLTEITESSAWFGGTIADDNLILRFEYTDDGIYEYESSIVTGEQLQTIDITQPQQWESNTQNIARTNIGLDPILTVDASNNYRGINVTDMTFTPADTEREYPRNGDGVGIYLSEDTVDLGYDHLQAEKLEFYGLRSDEPVILSNIAPGQEDYDAATVGQVSAIAEVVSDMNQDVADAYNNANSALSSIQSIGPAVSQVQTGLGALSALFDTNLLQNGITAADEGKFLRVVNGKLTLVSIPNAEDGEF